MALLGTTGGRLVGLNRAVQSIGMAAVAAPQPSGPMSQAFSLTNWGSAASLGVHKRGVWFRKGDVPAGSVPALSSGTAQFYGLTRWKDGSLKTARMLLRDAGLVAGATRSYTMTAATGTLSGSAKAIGNAGLVAALSGHDFKVTFSNVKDSTGAVYAGGTLVASLATHAAVPTRWETLSTGPVADVRQGWGMAGSDAHLKINWYVTRWKAADGSTLAWQIGAVPALDWWNVAGKTDLTYDATLADGATTILSFPAVQHYYHSQWLMCINDGGFNAGRVPFIGVAQPTLDYTFDKTYAILSGVVPPYRRDKMPPIPAMNPYVPCNVVPNDGHRTAFDAGGGYPGRGPVPRFDADAFMAQTPQAIAISRLNALTGLSVCYHYKSSRNRTRAGEAADVANTNIVLLMAPLSASASDFTAQGLPIAVDAYRGGTVTDGFVTPQQLQTNPWGSGSLDSTHAVSYSYYQALISGDEWFVDAELDITLNLAHQSIFGYHQQQPAWATSFNPACPTDRYTALLGLWQEGPSIRYIGWAALVQGHGFGLLPDDHQYKPAATALMSHNGDYIGLNLDYLPPDFAAAGVFSGYLGPHSSPWMVGFAVVGAYFHYALNEDTRWQRMGDHTANWAIGQAQAGRWYAWDNFRNLTRASTDPWNATTNPNLAPAQMPFFGVTFDLDATGTFTQTIGANWNDIGPDPSPLRNGDTVFFTKQGESGNFDVPTIPGVPEGTVGYIINLANGAKFGGQNHNNPNPAPRFQVSATLGGAPMTFGGQVISQVNMPTRVQSVGDPAYAVSAQPGDYLGFPYYFNLGNYISVNFTGFNMARHAGNAKVTAALRDAATAFVAPTAAITSDQNYYSAFDTVAIV